MLLIFKKHKMVIVDGMKDFRDVCCYWKIINSQHFHFAPFWRSFILLPFGFYSLRKQLNNREIDSSHICLICQISFCECILSVLWWGQNLEKVIWIKISMSNRILPENTTRTQSCSPYRISLRDVCWIKLSGGEVCTVFLEGSQGSTLLTSCMSWSCRSWDRVWWRRASCSGVSPSLSCTSSLASALTSSCGDPQKTSVNLTGRAKSYFLFP